MPLANDNPDDNIQWINLSLNALKEKNGEDTTNKYVATDTKNVYTTLKNDISDYWEPIIDDIEYFVSHIITGGKLVGYSGIKDIPDELIYMMSKYEK